MSSPTDRKGILIIQSLGAGDLLFSIPILRVLKRHFPNEPLTFVTNQQVSLLLSMVPEVAMTLTYGRSPSELLHLVRQVRALRFRMALVLNPAFRGALLAWLAGIPVRIGFLRDYERKQSCYGLGRAFLTHPVTPREENRHEADRYLELAERMNWQPLEEERVPRLVLSEEARRLGLSTLAPAGHSANGPTVAIHPGGGWAMKRWPPDRFARLADWLGESYGARIFFIGGKEEAPLVEKVILQLHHPAVNLAGKTTLPQIAGVLAACNLLIGNDTGSVHIAAALGVPAIALFGPTDAQKVRPRSPRVTLLHHPVPWGPCRVQYTGRCENNLCMQEIRLEEVQATVIPILGADPAGRPERKTGHFPVARRPQKILYLQSTSEIGGTDITLLRTVESLDRNRFEPHVVLPQDGPLVEEYRRAGCRVHLVPSMRQLSLHRGLGHLFRYTVEYLLAVARLAALVRRERIDLVHTNTLHNLHGFLAAFLSQKPHVWHVREIVVQSPFLLWLERRLVPRFSARFLVMDLAIAEMFLKPGGGLPANIAKLYDGVDLEMFHPDVSGSRIRSELGLPSGTPLIGMVARLDPAKGPDLFLEVAAQVSKKHPACRFLVCGGEILGHASYEESLRKKADELGISRYVFFTGWRYRFKDIPQIYGALDLCLQCPRHPEPYGLWCIEAMASGVPIVTFAQGGPAELCVDGETSLLVPPGDVAAAAETVSGLLGDPAKAGAMGKAGRKRAEALFDLHRCTRELEAHYESILAKQPVRPGGG